MKSKDKSGRTPAAYGGKREWAPEVRLKMAKAVVDGRVPVRSLSDALGIPLTTLQSWAERYRAHGVDGVTGVVSVRGHRKADAAASRVVDPKREAVTQQKREHPEQGSRRIRDVLSRFQGLGVSENTVRRILHEEGLMEETEMREKPKPVEHRFERAEPNQLWQSDIFTFLLRRHERLYIAAFLDDYSRYIVSLVVAHHQRASLVLEALTRGIADYGAPREVLTDQGRQYVSWRGQTEFAEDLRRQGIQHIKSRPHHPQTQGKIERFWKTLWEEFLSRTVFADFGDCQRRLELYVQAYNFRRPHQGIEGLVPADRFFRAAPQVREAIEQGVATNALALAHEKPRRKPFYLVGRLGEKDLSIALVGEGLLIKVGDFEELLELRKGAGDEESGSDVTNEADETAEEPPASDAEVALEGRGDGGRGEGALPDGARRAVGGEAGDGGDRSRGDLAGHVLPARDAGDRRDAASPGARDLGGRERRAVVEADRGARGEGEEAGAGPQAHGTLAALDPEGSEERRDAEGQANALDWNWQESFAKLEETEAESFDPDAGWRGRAVRWERKLAGGMSHVEDLPEGAARLAGGAASLQGGVGSAGGRADGERGGAPSEALAESLSKPDASSAGGSGGGPSSEAARPAGPTGMGEGFARGDGAPASGERAAHEAGGEHGSPAEPGSWSPDDEERS